MLPTVVHRGKTMGLHDGCCPQRAWTPPPPSTAQTSFRVAEHSHLEVEAAPPHTPHSGSQFMASCRTGKTFQPPNPLRPQRLKQSGDGNSRATLGEGDGRERSVSEAPLRPFRINNRRRLSWLSMIKTAPRSMNTALPPPAAHERRSRGQEIHH